MSNIGIINCGIGNLTSVRRAFDSIGYECDLIEDARDISDCKRLVLPGVGAFPSMMENLYRKCFSTEIIKHINSAKPFMGICLGMQVLFESSNEFKETQGLGVLKAKCNVCHMVQIRSRMLVGGTSKAIMLRFHQNYLTPILSTSFTHIIVFLRKIMIHYRLILTAHQL